MMNSAGTWVEYGRGVVEKEIYRRAGNYNLAAARQLSEELTSRKNPDRLRKNPHQNRQQEANRSDQPQKLA